MNQSHETQEQSDKIMKKTLQWHPIALSEDASSCCKLFDMPQCCVMNRSLPPTVGGNKTRPTPDVHTRTLDYPVFAGLYLWCVMLLSYLLRQAMTFLADFPSTLHSSYYPKNKKWGVRGL